MPPGDANGLKVPIGPYWFDVVEDTNLLDQLSDDEQNDGYCDLNACRIVLREFLHPRRKRVVLLHEVGHAHFELCGMHGHKDEEKFLRSIDGPLFDTLDRGEALRDYLFS